MKIPIDPIGYMVVGSTIHTRYNDHADGHRTRTTRGVEALLDGRKGRACQKCYPHPRYPQPPRPPQRRRVQTWAAPADLPSDSE